MTDVAVDLGKTTCRARVVAEPTLETEGAGAPGLADVEGTTRAAAAVLASLESLPTPTGVWGTLAIGAAGALAAPEAAAECAEILLRETGAQRVAIASDAVTAHLGAFGGGPGVTVIAGTGAVAVGLSTSGKLLFHDGAGPQAGDLGSGAWIGRTALERAAAGSTPLAQRAEQRYGADWHELLDDDRGYELARRRGEFVADVRALARTGDLTAVGIVREAAERLGATAVAAVEQLDWSDGPVPVALLGGLAGLGPVLTEPFGSAIEPARLVAPGGSALDGAALLVHRHDLPHEVHVQRRSRG